MVTKGAFVSFWGVNVSGLENFARKQLHDEEKIPSHLPRCGILNHPGVSGATRLRNGTLEAMGTRNTLLDVTGCFRTKSFRGVENDAGVRFLTEDFDYFFWCCGLSIIDNYAIHENGIEARISPDPRHDPVVMFRTYVNQDFHEPRIKPQPGQRTVIPLA
jgi:hypothetical protein